MPNLHMLFRSWIAILEDQIAASKELDIFKARIDGIIHQRASDILWFSMKLFGLGLTIVSV